MADNTENVAAAPAAPLAKKIVVDPNELVSLYERLYERQWNKETGGFRDPVNVARSLLSYGKVAALRILDLFTKHAALEERVVELEKFKEDMEKQLTTALQQFGEMVAAGPPQPEAASETPTNGAAPPTFVPPAVEKKENNS